MKETTKYKRSFVMPITGRSSCCDAWVIKLEGAGQFGSTKNHCSNCGRETHFLGHHPKEAITFTDMEGIFVNDNQYGKRVRQVKYMSKYFIAKKHGKIVRIELMESYTYNWATGRLYVVNIKNHSNKMVRDITYRCPAYQLDVEFVKKIVQMRAFYLLPEIDIIRDIEQHMGVKDIFQYIDQVFASLSHGDDVSTNRTLAHIMFCLAYPKFTWMNCPVNAAPTPRFRKALKEAKRQKDLYDGFFYGNAGKSTIKFLNDPLLGANLFGWEAVRLLSMFLNKDKIWSLINSGWIINLMPTNDRWYDDSVYRDFTPKAVSEFANEYGVDRLVNHIAEAAATERMGSEGILLSLKDCVIMWKNLKKELPEWTLTRANTFRATHDILARDTKKIEIDNEDIEYSWAETDYNTMYGDVEFSLPKDVHTIIDLGDKLDICVGGSGYTSSAVKKDIIILFGFVDDDPRVCIELRKDKLKQAKMERNAPAKDDDNICNAIKGLCDKLDIDYSGCYDMIGAPVHHERRYPQGAVIMDLFEEPAVAAAPLMEAPVVIMNEDQEFPF